MLQAKEWRLKETEAEDSENQRDAKDDDWVEQLEVVKSEHDEEWAQRHKQESVKEVHAIADAAHGSQRLPLQQTGKPCVLKEAVDKESSGSKCDQGESDCAHGIVEARERSGMRIEPHEGCQGCKGAGENGQHAAANSDGRDISRES
jgi:hypothetical protein